MKLKKGTLVRVLNRAIIYRVCTLKRGGVYPIIDTWSNGHISLSCDGGEHGLEPGEYEVLESPEAAMTEVD